MKQLALHEVASATHAQLLRGAGEVITRGLSTDSRTLAEGELFVALSGPNFDGNRFAQDALARGAGALLLRSEEGLEERLQSEVPILTHPDPRHALAELGAWHRRQLAAQVVGITGSCGKTTTKNILLHLLRQSQHEVVGSPGSYNNDIGVPLTLLLSDENTETMVVEIGTNRPGEIAHLCRLAQPTAGVITNVGAAHLEGLGSLEGVAREKGDLAASLPPSGFCVLNADCRFTPAMTRETLARVLTFSVEGDGQLDASDLVFHAGGTTFRLGEREVTSPLLGTHNVQNLLAALATCLGLGFELDDVLPAISTLSGGRQRMERLDLQELCVLDDSYNANPDSARAAVRVLAGMHGFGRRVLVLGDMLELGEYAAEAHHAIGMEAAQAGIDLFVLVGELTRAAGAGALEGGLEGGAVVHFASSEEAARHMPELVRDGDVCLVKGSRGLQLEQIVEALRDARRGEDG